MIEHEYSLLYGVMAVQLRQITPAQLAMVAKAWISDPARDLRDHLEGAGALTERDRRLLDRLVAEAVAAHDGDLRAALSHLGGEGEIERSFCGSVRYSPSGGVHYSSLPTMINVGEDDTEVELAPTVEETQGRYSQGQEHGRGGIGRVLLVHDRCLGRSS